MQFSRALNTAERVVCQADDKMCSSENTMTSIFETKMVTPSRCTKGGERESGCSQNSHGFQKKEVNAIPSP